MYCYGTSRRIRTASLSLPILVSLMLVLTPSRAQAQDSTDPNKTDRVDAISRRLEALEKQIEALMRENADLKRKFGAMETPTLAHAAEKKSSAPEPLEATVVEQENREQKKESRIQFGGEIRLRPEVSHNDPNSFAEGVDSLIRQRVRLHASAKLTDDLAGFVEIQDSRLWGSEFSTTNNFINVDLHQAYIQADRFLTPSLSLRIGRQELSYGNERLVGASDWDNVGRSFDAIKAVFARKSWSIDFFASRVADIRGFRIVVPDEEDDVPFSFPVPHQEFYGTNLKLLNESPNHKLEVYGFILRDNFDSVGEVGRTTDSTSIYTMGARHEAKFDGGFYFDGEAAFQTGHRGPDDHLAAAFAGRVGKHFKVDRSPRIGFEYAFATGDSDSRDRDSREFTDLFPTNHIHHGYMDLVGWRNVHDYRLNFGFNPTGNLFFDADYHKFLLHQAGGRWSNAAGRTLGFDPNGASSKQLGQELDFTLRFPYKEHMKFIAGYSVFLPGRFAKLTRGSSDFSHLSYFQTLISF